MSLGEERSRLINRLQKTLEDANIKLASVASDVMGRSARDMLSALLAGEVDPAVLAELARGRMRSKRELLTHALQGQLKPHHRVLLSEQLADIDAVEEAIDRMSTEITARVRPYEGQIQRLSTIPGIKRRLAEVLLAEIGPDVSRFPDARHLASWAGLCPGNNESAGKRLSGRTRKGVPGSAPPWWRPLMPPSIRKTAISLPSINDSLCAAVARRRRSQSDTRSW